MGGELRRNEIGKCENDKMIFYNTMINIQIINGLRI